MACVSARAFVWVLWFSASFVTGVYCALSLYSFGNVYRAYDDVDNLDDQNAEELRALLAATFFGSALVCLFTVVSFVILLGKTMAHSAGGFFSGLLLASSFHMFMTTLLCALVLHGFEDELEAFERTNLVDWTDVDTRVFKATYSMAYISSFVYLLFAATLTVCPTMFKEQKPEPKPENDSKEMKENA